MQRIPSKFCKHEKFVIVVDIIQTSRITYDWLFLSYQNNEGVANVADAEFFDKQVYAEQALKLVEPINDSIYPFIFPITVETQVSFAPDWQLAYKLLKDRGMK